MIISSSVYLPFPRSMVYAAYRDKLVEMLPYLPDIQRIEIKSCRKEGTLTHFVNEWHGGGEIPPVARVVLSEAMLSWTDYATWNDAEFTTDWRIETHVLTEAVYCTGSNRFLEEGNGTLIESKGCLIIDPQKITGVPPVMRGMVAKVAEDVLSKKIEPSLSQMGKGVQQYLKQFQTV
ncbi:MAG: hypothetical protein H7126_04650 [Candidatus Parcubacteria bacterium]|uniref:hypothetical protein n=1 Tax=Phormidesmis priestleyi TaxID=268141 RepID=UPI00083B8F13|nr:hypothetical protein [Phormidesmis priestleyi]MBC7823155.1 hypothetical protein [Leptolyngbyaceae cyanobacterium LF-bin-113]